MIVITLTNCPIALRGDLTKWLLEINTGVFVGRVSARVRENLWERIKKHIKNGQATMVYNAANEQGMDFKVLNSEWEPIDFDGVKLILRPSPSRIRHLSDTRKSGYSKASRRLAAKRAVMRKAYDGVENPSAYAVIDVETTGLKSDKSKIFELGAMIIVNGNIADSFTALIKTESPIPDKVRKLTGVTNEMLEIEGETLETALFHFLKVIRDLPLVAHNINFDISFINAACRHCGLQEIDNKQMDTLSMARQTVTGLNSYSIKVLSEHFGFKSETYHRALKDCYMAYQLYEKLIKLCSKKEQNP